VAVSTFTDEQYRRPFPPGIERHYWHAARNRILWRKIGHLVAPGALVVDVGCGPGIAVDHLRGLGIDCIGVDTGSPPPRPARVAPHLRLGTSAFELDRAVRERARVLLLLDVLEHLAEPEAFLARCAASFPNAEHVFVTVPARMELWSRWDEYYGHCLRYTLAGVAELAGGPWRLVASGHFFHGLYLAARVTSALGLERGLDASAPRGAVAAVAHRALGWLFDREEALVDALVDRPVRGTSICALFAKTGRSSTLA
jgi:hypothetical protein